MELSDNTMLNSRGLTVQTGDQNIPGDHPWLYNGPLASAIALRRNSINGSGISVGTGDPVVGPSDVLVEMNTVHVPEASRRPGWAPIHLSNQSHVLERGNRVSTDDTMR